MRSSDDTGIVQKIKVSSDRRFGSPGRFDEIRERNEAALADDLRQFLASFFREQNSQSSPIQRMLPHQAIRNSVIFNHIHPISVAMVWLRSLKKVNGSSLAIVPSWQWSEASCRSGCIRPKSE